MKKQKIKKNKLDIRVNNYFKESDKLARKLKLNVLPIINFRNKDHKPNLIAKFGLFLLRKNKAFLDTQFIDANIINNKNNKYGK